MKTMTISFFLSKAAKFEKRALLNEINRIWLRNVLNRPEPILLFTFDRKFIILIILRNQ